MQSLAEHIRTCEERGVPLKSAVMEHAVMRRQLRYRRMNRRVILVEPGRGATIPFYNM